MNEWICSIGGMILTGENRRSRRNTCPSTTLSTTNPTRTGVGLDPGLRGDRPAANRLSIPVRRNTSPRCEGRGGRWIQHSLYWSSTLEWDVWSASHSDRLYRLYPLSSVLNDCHYCFNDVRQDLCWRTVLRIPFHSACLITLHQQLRLHSINILNKV
jgi:hypothetical protein